MDGTWSLRRSELASHGDVRQGASRTVGFETHHRIVHLVRIHRLALQENTYEHETLERWNPFRAVGKPSFLTSLDPLFRGSSGLSSPFPSRTRRRRKKEPIPSESVGTSFPFRPFPLRGFEPVSISFLSPFFDRSVPWYSILNIRWVFEKGDKKRESIPDGSKDPYETYARFDRMVFLFHNGKKERNRTGWVRFDRIRENLGL